MSRYGDLVREYDDLVKRELKRNEELLKESFIEYFGEANRQKIEDAFKEIFYVYSIHWDTINMICSKVGEENRKYFKPYFDFRDAREDFYYTFLNEQIFPDCFIGTTNEEMFSNFNIYTFILERLKEVGAYTTIKKDLHGTKRIIFFNLFLTDEEVIIHEINHAVTRRYILEVIRDNTILMVDKSGLIVDDESGVEDEILEELLTEESSKKIYEIFKRRGGDLTSFLMGNIYGSVYEDNCYLVKDFFDAFEEKIKVSRMGENKNELLASVGKESYYLLCSLINEYFEREDNPPDSVKEANLDRVLSVIDYMKEYARIQERMTDEDLNAYYKYLESVGKRVTILNKVKS